MGLQSKIEQDGSLERIKAQLVAKRFSQVDGIDFLETFLLVLEVVKGRDIQHSSCTHSNQLVHLSVGTSVLHQGLVFSSSLSRRYPT